MFINVFSPDLESVFGRKKIALKHTNQNVARTRKIKYFKLLYFDKFSLFFSIFEPGLDIKKTINVFSPDLESVFGRKKIAPKHTKQNVARTRKIKYFSLGLKEAALLGPIRLDMRPMPPRELGGILYFSKT